MSEESSTARLMSITQYPGPACSYTIENGEPVILFTNATFEAQLGSGVEGETIPAAFETLDLYTEDGVSLSRSRLENGEEFRLHTSTATDKTNCVYRVLTVPPGNERPGFLLFGGPEDSDTNTGVEETIDIDHVASVVSHDLRNPIDVAKARLEAGRELGDDEHFEHVAQAHERMERIIQDVLTIARGEEVVEPDETVDLTDVAESAWETVETNGSRLITAERLPTATADPNRVGRLFENLFRNAVEHGTKSDRLQSDDGDDDRHAPSGVTVAVGCLDDGSGFYVADDGSGIPPGDRERVFEPGYSAGDHGVGLGLAIVARIAELHGWSVEVTDAESGGARFEIYGVDSVHSESHN